MDDADLDEVLRATRELIRERAIPQQLVIARQALGARTSPAAGGR